MKLNKSTKYKHKFIKVQLIKSKIYKKKHYEQNLKLKDIIFKLKKIMYIIYLYHINKKRILFVGNPFKINSILTRIFKNTNHLFMTTKTWIPGIITNSESTFKSVLNKSKFIDQKTYKKLLKLKNSINLIVIINEGFNKAVSNESYLAKVPVISLNNSLNLFDIKSNYKLPGNFVNSKLKLTNNFFYSLLFSILKKSEKTKQKKPHISYKLYTTDVLKKKAQKHNKKHKRIKLNDF